MDKNERRWGMLLHFSIFTGYIIPILGLVAPILIWQMKKSEYPVLDTHGKNVLNFLISMFLYSVVSLLLSLLLIGLPLLILLSVVGIVFPIIAGIKANQGVVWSYPYMLKLIK